MALKRTLKNPYTKQDVEAYCVIPKLDKFDSDQKRAEFCIYFYNESCTKADRTTSVILPFGSQKFSLTDARFDVYFSNDVLVGETTPMKQAYLAVKESSIVEDVETNPWTLATDV